MQENQAPKNKKPNRRYIAKIKNQSSQNGVFQKCLVENPNPQLENGSPNQYHKGVLLWYDHETQSYYQVKQLSMGGVPASSAQNGFVASLYIDLDNPYHVNAPNKQ